MQQLIVISSSWLSKVTPSGVQRLLDKLGSWVPSRISSIRSAKFRLPQFLATYFQSFTYIFPVPKVSHDFFLVIYQHFSLFRISSYVSRKFTPWMPAVLHYTLATTFSLFCHLPTFFSEKMSHWMPPEWIPGAVAPCSPPLSARHWSRLSPFNQS